MSTQKMPKLSLVGKLALLTVPCPRCGAFILEASGTIEQEFPPGTLRVRIHFAQDNPKRKGLAETYQLEDALTWVLADSLEVLTEIFWRYVDPQDKEHKATCLPDKSHVDFWAPVAGGPSKNHWAGPWRAQDATEVPWDELRGSDS